jgi:tRNA A-37 threonylcarbamoyl transferase component Bud32
MPDTTETARDEMIGRVVGSWRVIKLLGEGGMGSVYMGEHPAIGSKVAIKMLHPRFDADERIVERFFNEAKAVNVIGHENIVSILDFNVADGRRHYFVMEFLHGRPLQALVEAGAPVPLQRAGPILLQCCRALQAAHERRIVHRDFKPDNVFLVDRSGRADFVKLVDFGIAKLTDSPNAHLTQTGTVMGTPAYMSPEQAAGESTIDARSDIYSLGVTMFQMMTGKQPFAEAGPSFGRILAAHLREPPPLPRAINPGIPAELEEIILKTLEKNPDERYQTMSELHDALLGCMERLGISAELPPAAERQGTTAAKAPAARRSNPVVTPARGATLPARTVAHPAPPPRRLAPVVIVGAGAAVAIAIVVLALFVPRSSSAPQLRKPVAVPAAPPPAEAAEQKPPPSAQPPPSTTQQQSSDLPPAAQRSGGQTRAAPERTVAKATKPDRESPPPAAVPQRIAVFFQCAGAQEVCSALRTALDDELQKARFASVRSAARADIGISARVVAVQGRVTPDLQFAVRTFSIDVSGEAIQSSEAVPMPAPTTLSYDPSFGSERVAEKARLVGGEIAEKLQAFFANQRR